jgi:hypothetical protein
LIQITCTNCRKQLAIDDAFAGGVCRCHECGTIQTVPARLKQGAAGASQGARTSRTLYKQRVRSDGTGSGTGLDELAEIVASSGSGLGSSGLTNTPPRVNRPATLTAPLGAPDDKKVVRLIAGVGGVIVVLLLVILAVIYQRLPGTAGGGGAGGGASTSATGQQPGQVPVSTATFCGVPLEGTGGVIYVLDRGAGTSAAFGNLRDAAFRSVESLGQNRKFQLVFWDNGTDFGAYPATLTFANKDNIATIRRLTADLFAHGQSDARPALDRALEQKPAAIVLATGKGWELDDSFVAMVAELRQKHDAGDVRIHTFAIGTTGASTALKQVAETTGGQYREVAETELQKFGE